MRFKSKVLVLLLLSGVCPMHAFSQRAKMATEFLEFFIRKSEKQALSHEIGEISISKVFRPNEISYMEGLKGKKLGNLTNKDISKLNTIRSRLIKSGEVYPVDKYSVDLAKKAKAPRKSKTIISIPDTETEYRSIFEEFEPRAYENTSALRKSILSTSDVLEVKSAADLLKSIESGGADPLIVIGHNKHGSIIFPDGSRLSFVHMDEAAKLNKKPMVYLSCNAKSYITGPSTGFTLNYAEAIKIKKYLDPLITNFEFVGGTVTLEDALKSRIAFYTKKRNVVKGLKVSGYTTGGLASAYGLYVIKKDN